MQLFLREDVELVDGVHGELNVDDYLAGKVRRYFLEVPSIILV